MHVYLCTGTVYVHEPMCHGMHVYVRFGSSFLSWASSRSNSCHQAWRLVTCWAILPAISLSMFSFSFLPQAPSRDHEGTRHQLFSLPAPLTSPAFLMENSRTVPDPGHAGDIASMWLQPDIRERDWTNFGECSAVLGKNTAFTLTLDLSMHVWPPVPRGWSGCGPWVSYLMLPEWLGFLHFLLLCLGDWL